jgi:F0F1-type ATP synthase membrane subunit b/b'
MTDEQTHDMPQAESAQELDRVRDIIFGSQMREYQQMFQMIRRDLDRLQQAIDHLTEQLAEQDSSQGKKLQALRREVRQADDDLRSEMRQTAQELATSKVDRVTLGELFLEVGTRLKSGRSLADLIEDLAEADQDQGRGES